MDVAALVRRAAEAGVGVQALSDFSIDGAHPGLVLGFGAIEVGLIEPGIRRLGKLVK